MSKHLSAAKINTALKRKIPAAADQVYQSWDLVLAWREKQVENRKEKFVCPYAVIAVDPIHKNVLARQDDSGSL